MTIQTSVPRGEHGARIWPSDGEQLSAGGTEVIGPRSALIEVRQEPALSPYSLDLAIRLDEGRYLVAELKAYGKSSALDYSDVARRDINGDEDDFDPTPFILPPITARGMAAIQYGAIMREALRREVSVRRLNSRGDTVTGIGREDEVPAIYCLARAAGDNPTQAVADELKIGRSAAAQRVARARRAGLLPATTRGAR